MRSVSRSEAERLDRRAQLVFGIPSLLLMDAAGRASANIARERVKLNASTAVLVLAGPGNNGGDGLACARHLANRIEVPVVVVLVASDERLQRQSDAAGIELAMASRAGLTIRRIRSSSASSSLGLDMNLKETLMIDALIGIGQRGEVREPERSIIATANSSGAEILALDIPSGIDSDHGTPMGVAIRASTTVTFGLPKNGLLTPEGRRYAGRVIVAEIGFPRQDLALPEGDRLEDFFELVR